MVATPPRGARGCASDGSGYPWRMTTKNHADTLRAALLAAKEVRRDLGVILYRDGAIQDDSIRCALVEACCRTEDAICEMLSALGRITADGFVDKP